jgi:peptidoglycan/LPS O-acetylase OafA/YrhL
MITKTRNFGLDVTRAVSIICVLIAHRFTLPIELGIVGVQIFFVLSGFLIGQILIKDFKTEGKLSTILNFWKRRWYRTLPLYYLVLIFKIIIYGNPFGWKMIVYFLFLQANIIGISFFGVSWSLVVEEWFYIFLPIAVFIFFRRGIEFKNFFLFLCSFIFLFLLARFFWNYLHKGVIIYQFDCLLLGVLLSLIKICKLDLYKKLNSFFVFSLGFIGLIGLTLLLGKFDNISMYNTFYKVVWYFFVSFCVFLLIPFVEQSTVLNIKLRKVKPVYQFFTWTSILTYSIYLLHMEVLNIPMNYVPSFLILTIQIIVLYLVCFLVYAFFEHPALSLREQLSVKQYMNAIKSFTFKI